MECNFRKQCSKLKQRVLHIFKCLESAIYNTNKTDILRIHILTGNTFNENVHSTQLIMRNEINMRSDFNYSPFTLTLIDAHFSV